jgi:HAE1 family hydrophobic/amphiphilic exporter-1
MMVPLDQIASVTMGKGPAQIQHLDGKRMVAVSSNTPGARSARSPPTR